MNFLQKLNEARKYYNDILQNAKKINYNNLEGRLAAYKRSNDKYKYFQVIYRNGIPERKYINKSKLALAQQLAKKSYSQELAALAEKRISQLDEILKDYNDNEVDKIYLNLNNGVKVIMLPIIPTYEMQVQEFKDKPRTYLDLYNHAKKFQTKNGEYVRSKSEKIIADLLYDYGLAYVYEARISFEYQSYYPDFTVFHPIKRTEIYWEHFGMLSDFEYNANTYKKIMNYELNGYLTNDRLIVTMEFQNDLNIEWVKMLIENVLLK